MTQSRPHGLSIFTKCNTVEEFIDEFHTRTANNTIFVPTLDTRMFGRECAFVILLANQQPVLAGTCVVIDVFPGKNNPYKLPGMRLAIKRMGAHSQQVFAALEAANELDADPDTLVKPPRIPIGTDQLPPLDLGDGSVVIRTEPRAPSPQLFLPTNSLMDIDDVDGVGDCRQYDTLDDDYDPPTLVKKR